MMALATAAYGFFEGRPGPRRGISTPGLFPAIAKSGAGALRRKTSASALDAATHPAANPLSNSEANRHLPLYS
jgi:hypothetical protein